MADRPADDTLRQLAKEADVPAGLVEELLSGNALSFNSVMKSWLLLETKRQPELTGILDGILSLIQDRPTDLQLETETLGCSVLISMLPPDAINANDIHKDYSANNTGTNVPDKESGKYALNNPLDEGHIAFDHPINLNACFLSQASRKNSSGTQPLTVSGTMITFSKRRQNIGRILLTGIAERRNPKETQKRGTALRTAILKSVRELWRVKPPDQRSPCAEWLGFFWVACCRQVLQNNPELGINMHVQCSSFENIIEKEGSRWLRINACVLCKIDIRGLGILFGINFREPYPLHTSPAPPKTTSHPAFEDDVDCLATKPIVRLPPAL